MKRLTLFFICYISVYNVFAQEQKTIVDSTFIDGVPFKSVNEFYIFGDVAVIGNNIISKDSKKPFNDRLEDNDNIKMKYVDIDDNPETFSSSQATLKLPNDVKKIAYAGLYWTATYAYEKGTRKSQKENYIYRGNGKRSPVLNQIQFKIPDQDYKSITGQVIYDGSTNTTHVINSPYVCYADVTNMLQELNNASGDYTVANVKATEGFLSGGSSAGWMLYVIYQSPTDNPKYISTYNGFALVNHKPVDIRFKNFKSVNQGDVKTSIVVSALEGDNNLQYDQCAIIKANKNEFQSLSNGARYQQNFFNSTITNNSIINRDRLPNSENTLGFDIAQLDIPNYNNSLINNSMSETTLRLNTQSDRYYLYFTAFQTEISQTYFNDVVQDNTKTATTQVSVAPEIIRSNPETQPSYNTIEKRKPYQYTKKGLNSKSFNYLKRKKSTVVIGIEGGYYVVTNVFSDATKASRWTANLIKKGFDADVFVNPKNNWNYVYVLRSDTAEDAFKLMEELKTNYRYRDTWIFKANLD